MPARLDHTIVHSRDRFAAARFLTELIDAPEPKPFGPFASVPLANGVTLDYLDGQPPEAPIVSQHLAFLVGEQEFDDIFGRIRERRLPYWADPAHAEPQRINHLFGGRGVYIDDPDGHSLEFITHTYV
ncbi:bleomycin resistance protein [Streptomyces spongiicola]|uniref:Bleomycin resistance protein n=1 Tax=Streptomyces spongiicola TaxID=1690221 RepID=A0A2S1YXQ4_9ACTN|nr:VOC family protein [Streptomyces spongiicola]AWK08897.1 bleomycin resistance protein [Streptomyces spongiicola]GBP99758.1 bleomycin resistance protein [Streptomyces spongiicola]